jgi:hypothetical protein
MVIERRGSRRDQHIVIHHSLATPVSRCKTGSADVAIDAVVGHFASSGSVTSGCRWIFTGTPLHQAALVLICHGVVWWHSSISRSMGASICCAGHSTFAPC